MYATPPQPVALGPYSKERLQLLFVGGDQKVAEKLLVEECGSNLPFLSESSAIDLERYRIAALKISHGSIEGLRRAIDLAQADWRDLLMAAGFGHDTAAHLSWMPSQG